MAMTSPIDALNGSFDLKDAIHFCNGNADHSAMQAARSVDGRLTTEGDPNMDKSLDNLHASIGRSETMRDDIGATPVKALNATLDHPASPVERGAPLPPLWHWLYFLPLHRQSEIGPDGHARRGGFLPSVPLPRRMWAGSEFEFRSPVPSVPPDAVRSILPPALPQKLSSLELADVGAVERLFTVSITSLLVVVPQSFVAVYLIFLPLS